MNQSKQDRKRTSVLENREKFGDTRAEEKLSHMGSKPSRRRDQARASSSSSSSSEPSKE
jgi:hypothetical protein